MYRPKRASDLARDSEKLGETLCIKNIFYKNQKGVQSKRQKPRKIDVTDLKVSWKIQLGIPKWRK